MANFGAALRELRQERSRAEREVERLNEAISVLEGLGGRNHVGRPARGGRTARMGRPRRRMSAAGRRKIAAAQRARWAKLRARNVARSKARQAMNGRGGPRRLNAAARNRIAAAQRARWAKLKAKNKAAARTPKKPVQKAQAAA
jgi:hypothetical protein